VPEGEVISTSYSHLPAGIAEEFEADSWSLTLPVTASKIDEVNAYTVDEL
jgi:hypothetical protein